MQSISSISELEALYGQPSDAAIRKVSSRLTPLYRRWIMASRFCVLTSVGPDGTDGSPRGEDGPVVHELDSQTLAMPDWRGNNRLDSLRNIVSDGRVSLMFMVPGSTTIVRVNGRAVLSADADLRARFSPNMRGIEVPPERAASMIDEYPILSVVAAYAQGDTVMRGVKELRVKESDRIDAMATGLRANGIAVEDGADWWIVSGCGAQAVPGGATCAAVRLADAKD